MTITLSGPSRLTEEMAAMLAPQGIDAKIVEGRDSELTVRVDNEMLRARLDRISEFLSTLRETEQCDD